MTTITTRTGGYSTAGYGHYLSVAAPLLADIEELTGALSAAEVRVIEDAVAEEEMTLVIEAVAGIVADREGVADDDYDALGDIEEEVRQALA